MIFFSGSGALFPVLDQRSKMDIMLAQKKKSSKGTILSKQCMHCHCFGCQKQQKSGKAMVFII